VADARLVAPDALDDVRVAGAGLARQIRVGDQRAGHADEVRAP
jgi:hypothetical protein